MPRTSPSIDAGRIDALLALAPTASARELLDAATRAIVALLGDRGSCIFVEGMPRVLFATAAPDLVDLPIDAGRYPEITAALVSGEVVAIEDVRRDPLLASVSGLLPRTLGAVAVVPLVAGRRTMGVLLAQAGRPRTMRAEDRATARTIGRLVATVLDARHGATLGLAVEATRGRGGRSGTPIHGISLRRALDIAGARILVAEDDVVQAEGLRDALEGEGFAVTVVHDGAAAVTKARALRPDLVLLDVCMPRLDGFGAAEALVADASTSDTPILFLSGAEDLLPRVRGLRVDAMDFMQKPYTVEELLARVDRCLRQAELRSKLRLEANIDDLTGLGNVRFLRERMAVEESRMERYGTTLAVVMADVDKLKQINDRHGHVVGSQVLRAIGEALRDEIRETDLAARYGGDEFAILLPHTSAPEAAAFAERVLGRLRGLRPAGMAVSVSLGVAASERGDGQAAAELLGQADAAAYRAKRAGGDRVCAFDPAVDAIIGDGQQRIAAGSR